MSPSESSSEIQAEETPKVTEVVNVAGLSSPVTKRIATVVAGLVIAVCAFFVGYAVRGDSSKPAFELPQGPNMTFPGG